MAITPEERKIRKIMKQVIQDMKDVGTYRSQFEATIRTYSEMRFQYDLMMKDFFKEGCKTTEEYTNNAGVTNVRKTATYLAIETIRKDMINHENTLGLTPAGLKRINDEMKTTKKKSSKLASALSDLR
ncbi:P27 family phage terminase small subunit [Fictibacillus sp. 23RED33]|uniref:P27 family phage terminase small subunit n=1 Tax=Fictibacillus sp. 23RED33 TaxID=2745879 RepID=UPI0018CE5C38|nr:P27 family phage terminase small subunit [Fictibacillus sp. 23RED33]MBH0174722.1 P27 family phage terminase small subunit [Fictibacillus sp. 23RED33]